MKHLQKYVMNSDFICQEKVQSEDPMTKEATNTF